MDNIKKEVNKLDWFTKDGKAKNKTQIFKGVGKKFNSEELSLLNTFLSTLPGIESVYIKDGHLDVYYDNMKIYPSIYCLKRDGFL